MLVALLTAALSKEASLTEVVLEDDLVSMWVFYLELGWALGSVGKLASMWEDGLVSMWGFCLELGWVLGLVVGWVARSGEQLRAARLRVGLLSVVTLRVAV